MPGWGAPGLPSEKHSTNGSGAACEFAASGCIGNIGGAGAGSMVTTGADACASAQPTCSRLANVGSSFDNSCSRSASVASVASAVSSGGYSAVSTEYSLVGRGDRTPGSLHR